MAVPSTNTSLSDIQTEFGGSNPIQLSEYYSGGPLVPSGSPAPNGPIPSSGQISIGQFRASEAQVQVSADYLIISGGAGGSAPNGGGGGAGGMRFSNYGPSPLNTGTAMTLIGGTTYPVVVGAGGSNAGYVPSFNGTRGSDSIFNPGGSEGTTKITTEGGGYDVQPDGPGADGGSGAGRNGWHDNPGGTGNTPPFSPPQGNNGGDAGNQASSSGGGGAGAAGNPGSPGNGAGGNGVAVNISGSPVTYAGGGGSGSDARGYSSQAGAGGSGGGGAGNGGAGQANTGGGGGGGYFNPGGGQQSGAGGSGRVQIRIPSTHAPLVSVTPGTNSVATHPGGDKIATFTVSGNLVLA
tara:strand:+ start:1929 stop:2981 length:1053 start_codon:yes stop_codon:yes gene_type:complete